MPVEFGASEKTRWFGTKDGDRFLCKEHAEKRLPDLKVPAGGANAMFGLIPWPTGKEECDDCKAGAIHEGS